MPGIFSFPSMPNASLGWAFPRPGGIRSKEACSQEKENEKEKEKEKESEFKFAPSPTAKYVDRRSYLFDEKTYKKKNLGGVVQPFPEKLMSVLSETDDTIIGWQSHGRSFKIRDQRLFVEDVMPRHFKHTKLASFQRQLNLYGFRRITKGADAGAYYHEYFLRNRPDMVVVMRRQKIKGSGHRKPHDLESEPNFYADFDPVGPLTVEQDEEIKHQRRKSESEQLEHSASPAPSMPPEPRSLAKRLSERLSLEGMRAPELARTFSSISMIIKKVSSLGSDGWDHKDSIEDEAAVDVDFDQIFGGENPNGAMNTS